MSEKWKAVPLAEAQAHPLYGVGGWLAFYAVTLVIVGLTDFGAVMGVASKANMTVGQLFALDDPGVNWMKLVLGYEGIGIAITFWLMFEKAKSFRMFGILWRMGLLPFAGLVALVNPFPGSGEVLGAIVGQWLGGLIIWCTYLQVSKRVRVTFENLVRADERPLVQRVATATVDAVGTAAGVVVAAAAPAVRAAATAASNATQAVAQAAAAPASIPQSQQPLVAPAPQHQDPRPATQAMPAIAVPIATEEIWAVVLREFDGPGRRPGPYAQAFAEAGGDEAGTKARYLARRAGEVQAAAEAMERARKAQEASDAAARLAEERERELAEQARRGAGEKHACPLCAWFVTPGEKTCPYCNAQFGPPASWDLIPVTEAQRVATMVKQLDRNRAVLVEDVMFLCAVAARHPQIVSMTLRGESLLHVASRLDMAGAVKSLLEAGADRSAKDRSGRTPAQVAKNPEIATLLNETAVRA